jgi:hypothetical protein
MTAPLATHDFAPAGVAAALEFLKRTRAELRMLRRVLVSKDRVQVFDINGDYFEIRGIGYLDPDVIPILRSVNTVFDPAKIHEPVELEWKEFGAGRRRAWAEDRVM